MTLVTKQIVVDKDLDYLPGPGPRSTLLNLTKTGAEDNETVSS